MADLVFMDEERFAQEVQEAFLLESAATGIDDAQTAIRVAARVAANYGLIAPSGSDGIPPVDDHNTLEY